MEFQPRRKSSDLSRQGGISYECFKALKICIPGTNGKWLKISRMVPDRRKCKLPNYRLDGNRVIVKPWCDFHIDKWVI